MVGAVRPTGRLSLSVRLPLVCPKLRMRAHISLPRTPTTLTVPPMTSSTTARMQCAVPAAARPHACGCRVLWLLCALPRERDSTKAARPLRPVRSVTTSAARPWPCVEVEHYSHSPAWAARSMPIDINRHSSQLGRGPYRVDPTVRGRRGPTIASFSESEI